MYHTFVLFFCFWANTDVWDTLAKVSWNQYYSEELGFDVSEPNFSPEVLALNSKEITVKGYIMPIDSEPDYMVLSRFAYANCFFCGQAGPETVMEVFFPRNIKYFNKKVTLKGILKLNSNDFYRLTYRLEKAKVLSVE
jgi:hypothetical protein